MVHVELVGGPVEIGHDPTGELVVDPDRDRGVGGDPGGSGELERLVADDPGLEPLEDAALAGAPATEDPALRRRRGDEPVRQGRPDVDHPGRLVARPVLGQEPIRGPARLEGHADEAGGSFGQLLGGGHRLADPGELVEHVEAAEQRLLGVRLTGDLLEQPGVLERALDVGARLEEDRRRGTRRSGVRPTHRQQADECVAAMDPDRGDRRGHRGWPTRPGRPIASGGRQGRRPRPGPTVRRPRAAARRSGSARPPGGRPPDRGRAPPPAWPPRRPRR